MPRQYSLGLREARVGETRDCIVASLLRLMACGPYDSVTISQIAREADVAEKTVHRHFASKGAIFVAWAESAAAAESARLMETVGGDCPRCATQRLVRGLFRVYEENSGRMWDFVRAGSGSEGIAAYQADFVRFRRRLASVVVDGCPGAWRLGRERTVQLLVTATSFLTWKALREQSELSEEEAAAAVLDGIERTLMNRGPGGGPPEDQMEQSADAC